MTNLRQVTYCGLYCDLCGRNQLVPKQARDLRETLHKGGMEIWGSAEPDFQEFWRFLGKLSEQQCSCREETCGSPYCKVT